MILKKYIPKSQFSDMSLRKVGGQCLMFQFFQQNFAQVTYPQGHDTQGFIHKCVSQ